MRGLLSLPHLLGKSQKAGILLCGESEGRSKNNNNKENVGKQGKSMSNELPRMDVMAAGSLREYHVSFVSVLQSVLHVRWQSRLGYA